MSIETMKILDAIHRERTRQERLKENGRFRFTCADHGITEAEKLSILVEEVGEVARAVAERADLVTDKQRGDLRTELIQVAAVATAWAESLSESKKT